MLELLLSSRIKNDVSITNMVMIGRQNLHLSAKQLGSCLKKFNYLNGNAKEILENHKGYAESFFQYLGANNVDSIDVSNYEKATIISDMNEPIDEIYRNKYDLVLDSGTLEHVFNIPQAIKNCMNLTSEGGHYIGIYPCNNFFGHGFYQFSSELFYRIFSKENGFKIEKVLLFVDEPNTTFYNVPDSSEENQRLIFTNSKPVYIYIVAKKIEDVLIFQNNPLQKDYSEMKWKGIRTISRKKVKKRNIKNFIPLYIKKIIKAILNIDASNDSLNFNKPFFSVYHLK